MKNWVKLIKLWLEVILDSGSLFIGPLAVTGRVPWSVHPSFSPSGIELLVSSKFWHTARNPYEAVHDSFRDKNIYPPKLAKTDQKWSKIKGF